MTTSGTASFNLDLNEMVEEAFERAGSQLRTGYDLRTARRSLNLLFADWANRGVNMWTFEQNTWSWQLGGIREMIFLDSNSINDVATKSIRLG
jgi:hypothetical protein